MFILVIYVSIDIPFLSAYVYNIDFDLGHQKDGRYL